jgi:hypothetical protein
MSYGDVSNKQGTDFKQNIAKLAEEQKMIDESGLDRTPLSGGFKRVERIRLEQENKEIP